MVPDILNAYTAIIMISAGLGFLLALGVGGASVVWRARLAPGLTPEQAAIFEDRAYLLSLAAVILFLTRMLDWPLYLAGLQSLIPNVEGAMCIFGVTQAPPHVTGVLMLVKPLGFLLAGAWLCLHLVDRANPTGPLMRLKFSLSAALCLLFAAECALEFYFFFAVKASAQVVCCTKLVDLANRPTSVIPQNIFGTYYQVMLAWLFIGAALAAIISGWRDIRRKGASWLTFSLTVLGAALFIFAVPEAFAPKWMGLPHHHCWWCFVARPDAPLISRDALLAVALMALGFASFIWAKVAVIHQTDAREKQIRLSIFLLKAGIIFLSAALVMFFVHWLQ